MKELVKITKSKEPSLKEWRLEDKEGNCCCLDMERMSYDKHVDLEKMALCPNSKEYPALNGLCDEGKMERKFCYAGQGFDFSDKFPNNDGAETTHEDLDSMLRKIQEKGWSVSEEALERCVTSWRNGFKSGYRDEENGVHVFIPCGTNPPPPPVALTGPRPFRTDWQKTHYC